MRVLYILHIFYLFISKQNANSTQKQVLKTELEKAKAEAAEEAAGRLSRGWAAGMMPGSGDERGDDNWNGMMFACCWGKENTGEDLSARAMLEYFSPLMGWLKEQNKGRNYTLAPL